MRTLSLQYQLSVKSWQQHLFAVELKVPEHNEATLTFALPSWIPGSYMIRDKKHHGNNLYPCRHWGRNSGSENRQANLGGCHQRRWRYCQLCGLRE